MPLGSSIKAVHMVQTSIVFTHSPTHLRAFTFTHGSTYQFNRLLTPEQRSEIESSHQHINDTGKSNLRALPPDSLTNSQLYTRLSGLDTSALDPSALLDMFRESVWEGSKPRFPPPEVLPCANVEAEKYRACPNPGKMACSSCRLVSYCSKVSISLH
jgi:hypothetical protein